MSYLNKILNPDLVKKIDAALAERQKPCGIVHNHTGDVLAEAMFKELQKEAEVVIQKNTKLNPLVSSIVRLADYLDLLSEEVAVAHLEDALEKLASIFDGVLENEYQVKEVTKEDIQKVIQIALIETSDKLDKLGFEDISTDIDKALGAFIKNCK